jgi:membrane protein implicated in regulation of membrane protease activity
MIRTILMTYLSAWASEFATLVWLALAFVSAIVEVSIPHFGFAFVGAGAIAAAAAAFLGFTVTVQVGTFVVVMSISLVALRSRLVGYLGGKGIPSRTAALVGRDGIVTHEIDPTLGSGRVNVGGEDWAARSTEIIATGARIRVTGADGIVLEVTRT